MILDLDSLAPFLHVVLNDSSSSKEMDLDQQNKLVELNIATQGELAKIHPIALISDRCSCWDVDFVWHFVGLV